MGKLLIILCDPPFQYERVEHALRTADTALDKGHRVSFYLLIDDVYNIITSQKGDVFRVIPISERLKELMLKGTRVTCCKLCMELRGLEESMMPEGVIVGGISDLNDEISEARANSSGHRNSPQYYSLSDMG